MTETMLVCEKRAEKGKAAARRLRRTGNVPAILYGEKNPVELMVNAHDLEMMVKQEHAVINLKVEGKEKQVIVREVQYHPVKSHILHIDFMSVAEGHKINLEIPLHFEGKAIGVKEGGMFTVSKHHLNISVMPKDIPNFIPINIENMKSGDTIRVKDIQLPNVEILEDPEDVLCRVEIPRGVEAVEEVAAEAEAMAEPEVITARRKEEEE